MFNPQKTQLNQLYMPLTVKVQYKDKLFKLAQATLTLQQVHNEMKQRFPNIVSFHYYYKDEQVNDLSAIMTQASREGNTSVKLIAKKASLEISLLNESSVVFEQEKNESSNISLLVQSEIKMEQKPKVSLPNEFYVCFNCQGAKFIKSNSTVELCSICKGVGRLEQAHKYISRLRELYLKHFKPIAQAETILEKFRQEEIPQRKGSFARVDKNYDIIVRQTTKKETMQVGKIFSMRFQIKNIGPSWQKRSIEVIEMGQNQGKTLSALKNGEVMEIQLGPFICNNEGLFEKTYTLCFRQGESLVRFGHKFGFSVKGFKAKPVRKIVSNQRERIRDLKMISGSSKSEQYLSLKLKSMGIDIMNLQIDEELIIEMIKQFK